LSELIRIWLILRRKTIQICL